MTDLLQVVPDFDTRPYSHLLPSLDKALITTSDLLTLEPAQIGKRAQLPTGDLKKLTDAIVAVLHRGLGFGGEEAHRTRFLDTSVNSDSQLPNNGLRCISTLDEKLDAALGGGVPPGHLVEVTGERYSQYRSIYFDTAAANSSQRRRQNTATADTSAGLTASPAARSLQVSHLHLD